MIFSTTTTALAILVGVLTAYPAAGAFPTNVTVPPHGTYTGKIISRTDLPQEVNAWLGLKYATQPVGKYRYAPAVPLPHDDKHSGDQHNVTAFGKSCLQNPAAPAGQEGEDCLVLNIYRPKNADPKALLPVAFYIHGGSFNTGAGSSIDGAAFVARAKVPLMMVTINYRLGAFGFLSSEAFEELGLLNLGFTDQSLALYWVHNHIESFGGNKSEVTLMGLSAGAHSVGYHYLAQSEAPLFARATMHSGGPTSRAYPNSSFPLYEKQFSQFMQGAGCDEGQPSQKIVDCLRSKDAALLNKVGSGIFAAPQSQWTVTWPFQPVLGGPLMPRLAHKSWDKGLFNHFPIITGFCNDEGRAFAPGNLSTNAQFESFFKNLLPDATDAHIKDIESLYPDPATISSSVYTHSPMSPQFARTAAAYGDYAYICQTQENAVGATTGGVNDVWKYHWAQNNSFPAARGIPHTCDQVYQWASPTVQGPRIAQQYHAWLASFVASGNPNTFKLDNDTLDWPRYKDGGSHGKQMFIQDGNNHVEADAMRLEQCQFWRSIPGELYH